MYKIVSLIIILFLVVSCGSDSEKKVDVSGISVEVEIDRFEQKFYGATATTLSEVKQEYPYLFPTHNHDSIWLQKIEGEKTLFESVQKEFQNFSAEEKKVENLFKHIKYYHPTFNSPKILTLITDLDYESRVIYADSLLLVSLDLYLGADKDLYEEFPKYISQNFNKDQLIVDMAETVAERYIIPGEQRRFMELMINEGKKKYLINSYLPNIPKARIMGYSNEKMDWVQANELPIWTYFVERNLLFSTDPKLRARFIEKAPFSKFYIDIDRESPGSIGVWLGWQIVATYMKNNTVTLQQLLQANAEEIYQKSKYKPKK